jgi:hypothetical protein
MILKSLYSIHIVEFRHRNCLDGINYSFDEFGNDVKRSSVDVFQHNVPLFEHKK